GGVLAVLVSIEVPQPVARLRQAVACSDRQVALAGRLGDSHRHLLCDHSLQHSKAATDGLHRAARLSARLRARGAVRGYSFVLIRVNRWRAARPPTTDYRITWSVRPRPTPHRHLHEERRSGLRGRRTPTAAGTGTPGGGPVLR